MILEPGGALAQAIPHYEDRPEQRAMSAAVARALEDHRSLIVEAGTGTGKTLAYLVPAILSGKRVVVSTGTRALQDQIARHDLPLLRTLIPKPFDAVLLKGVSNYVCKRKLAEVSSRGRSLPLFTDQPEDVLPELIEWASSSQTGDRSEVDWLAESAPLWSEITTTPDARIGPRCPHFERCFVTQARRLAEKAQLILVNHHLYFADRALRAGGGRVLPDHDAVIFDEAHQLEDVATEHFGARVSNQAIQLLVRDAHGALAQMPLWTGGASDDLIHAVERAAIAMWSSIRGELLGETDARVPLPENLFAHPDRQSAWFKLDNALEELARAADEESEPSPDDKDDPLAASRAALAGLARRARDIRDDLAMIAEQRDRSYVYWGEARTAGTTLSASPIEVADLVRRHITRAGPTTIFTSATLATAPAPRLVMSPVARTPDADHRARVGLSDGDGFPSRNLDADDRPRLAGAGFQPATPATDPRPSSNPPATHRPTPDAAPAIGTELPPASTPVLAPGSAMDAAIARARDRDQRRVKSAALESTPISAPSHGAGAAKPTGRIRTRKDGSRASWLDDVLAVPDARRAAATDWLDRIDQTELDEKPFANAATPKLADAQAEWLADLKRSGLIDEPKPRRRRVTTDPGPPRSTIAASDRAMTSAISTPHDTTLDTVAEQRSVIAEPGVAARDSSADRDVIAESGFAARDSSADRDVTAEQGGVTAEQGGVTAEQGVADRDLIAEQRRVIAEPGVGARDSSADRDGLAEPGVADRDLIAEQRRVIAEPGLAVRDSSAQRDVIAEPGTIAKSGVAARDSLTDGYRDVIAESGVADRDSSADRDVLAEPGAAASRERGVIAGFIARAASAGIALERELSTDPVRIEYEPGFEAATPSPLITTADQLERPHPTTPSFSYQRARLGLDDADELIVPSPFDYAKQALLYLPRDLPPPHSESFATAGALRTRELLDITRGRAFLLFTSHRALREAAALLAHLPYPTLVQGDAPPATLVDRFRATPNSVLLGTGSFWEGVDVPGDALSLVVIDKLPFAPHTDPLIAARMQNHAEAGLDPFDRIQLPAAALALKQGFGRLIRRRDDRGIVAILDSRIVVRQYGRAFIDTLPAGLQRTSAIERVRRWWAT